MILKSLLAMIILNIIIVNNDLKIIASAEISLLAMIHTPMRW
jgi:hypothetical protein